MTGRPGGSGPTAQGLIAIVLIAPLLFLAAAFGLRLGLLSVETAYDLMVRQIAFGISFAGLAAALALMGLAWRKRASWPAAAVVLALAVATTGLFVKHHMEIARGDVENVSTDLAEVPGFGRLDAQRTGSGPTRIIGPDVCPGARPVMTQIAPEAAAEALQQAGFDALGAYAARAEGSRPGFWFGFDMDAVVRIRPTRTDIRVAARDGRPHGGQACILATRLSRALEERR